MKIAITLDSAEGLRRGLPEARSGWAVVDVDPSTLSDAERETLIACTRTARRDGTVNVDADRYADSVGGMELGWQSVAFARLAAPTVECLREAIADTATRIDARKREVLAEKAEKERTERARLDAKIAAALTDGVDALLTSTEEYDRDKSRRAYRRWFVNHDDWTRDPRLDALRAAASAEAAARTAASLEAAREADRVEKASALAAREAARDVVRRFATADLQRFDEGLMADTEVAQILRNAVFAPIDTPTYNAITFSDLEHTEDCEEDPDEDVRAVVCDAEKIDRETYARLVAVRAEIENSMPAIRDAFPAAAVVISPVQEHEAFCDCDAQRVRRYSLLVTVAYKHWKVARRYAV